MELFKKVYDGESLCDLDRDVSEAFQEDFNPLVGTLPKDEYGIQRGIFTITITWEPEEARSNEQ